ncbi:MAG: hypothetical protein J5934_05985 [Succinivibrio sp.]|nr:hypothetical protein [Succinivibrio sp.]
MSVRKKVNNDKLTVSFLIKADAGQNAKKICLLCEHNDWQPIEMNKHEDGTFDGEITVQLGIKPSYQYKYKYYMSDGTVKYDNDWEAEFYEDNPFGGKNSVFSAVV